MLQMMGGATMIWGALIAQRVRASPSAAPLWLSPRIAEGFLFAVLAALAYGASPIMTRTALQSAGPWGAITGGRIAYGAATAVVVRMPIVSNGAPTDFSRPSPGEVPHANHRAREALHPQPSQRELSEPVD
jgi:hypothetical protein